MTRVLAAEQNSNFLVPNATIFVELLLFLIILFIFSRFIVPPLTRAMREREEMNRKQAQDREEATRRLQEAEERYQAALADARKEATAIRDEARAEAQRIRDDMRAQTDREVARIREQGEQQLAEQRQQVLGELRSDIGGLSTQLAGRILGTPMGDGGPQQETVDRFLADLDAESGRPAEPEQTGSHRSGGGAS
jgi:F-type H+-transporting ATPase subunit b